MSLPLAHSEAWRCWNMVPQGLSGASASAEQVARHNRHALTEATIVRFKRDLCVGGREDPAELRRARERLLAKRAEIEAELTRIEERLRDAVALEAEPSDHNAAEVDQIAAE